MTLMSATAIQYSGIGAAVLRATSRSCAGRCRRPGRRVLRHGGIPRRVSRERSNSVTETARTQVRTVLAHLCERGRGLMRTRSASSAPPKVGDPRPRRYQQARARSPTTTMVPTGCVRQPALRRAARRSSTRGRRRRGQTAPPPRTVGGASPPERGPSCRASPASERRTRGARGSGPVAGTWTGARRCRRP